MSEDEEFADCLVIRPNAVNANFYSSLKPRFGHSGSAGVPSVPYNKLSAKQQRICELIQSHISKPLERQFSEAIRMVIVGQAGMKFSLFSVLCGNSIFCRLQERGNLSSSCT